MCYGGDPNNSKRKETNMQATKQTAAKIVNVSSLPIITWNTGRWYSEEGQRIAAVTLPDGRIVFLDYDRNIDGVIQPIPAPIFDWQEVKHTPRSIADHVMREYDAGDYVSVYTLDNSRELCAQLSTAINI